MKLLFQGLSAVLLAGSVVGAPTLEVALQAWREGDRSVAIATRHTLATRGHAEASLFLGYVYLNSPRVACGAGGRVVSARPDSVSRRRNTSWP